MEVTCHRIFRISAVETRRMAPVISADPSVENNLSLSIDLGSEDQRIDPLINHNRP